MLEKAKFVLNKIENEGTKELERQLTVRRVYGEENDEFSPEKRKKMLDDLYSQFLRDVAEEKEAQERIDKEGPTLLMGHPHDFKVILYKFDSNNEEHVLELMRDKFCKLLQYKYFGIYTFSYEFILRDPRKSEKEKIKLFILAYEIFRCQKRNGSMRIEYLRKLYNLFIIEGYDLLTDENYKKIIRKFEFL